MRKDSVVFTKLQTTKSAKPALKAAASSFIKDSSGQAGVEIAMVSVPFLTMIFGVVNAGMFFYAVNCVDRGVDDAARFIRTGEAQHGSASAGGNGTSSITAGQFRTLVCQRATSYVDCSAMQIMVQSGADWSTINPLTCPTDGTAPAGNIAANDGTPISTTAGSQNSVVLITVCYKWSLAKYLPYVKFDKRYADGSALIQSSTALKIEPYI